MLSEAALLICMFCVGLRLRAPLDWTLWRVPLRLASITFVATIGLIAGAASMFFGLTFPQAVLLGAILAPTDLVLSGEVPIASPDDPDGVRFALTTEGAIDCAWALPSVLFALGLLGRYDAGPLALRWLTVDLLWSAVAGLALGLAIGWAAARALERLDSHDQIGYPEALLLASTGAFAYVAALAVHGNGFLAVLAAGSALTRGRKLQAARSPVTPRSRRLGVLSERVERYVELVMLVAVGALLAGSEMRAAMFIFALYVLVIVRPLAARLGLGRLPLPERPRQAIRWFGIRGIACAYCLTCAINQGLDAQLVEQLMTVTLAVLVTSIALHALSALALARRLLDQHE
jgi:NhaP-type Na+/H+ or K+/H+ antiporter